ncbi:MULTISPECIES: hypothetical protein [Hyphobacterium]|uniref:DUF2975 domain-containing protein n=1 Tax=Hyphobacterium vulgare TaxID=1736751 RepID=A0ABV6ZUI7_9PROT
MMQPILFTLAVWRSTLSRLPALLLAAGVVLVPAAIVAVPFALTGHRFGPEADNPWLVWLAWLAVLITLSVPAAAALLRRGLGRARSEWFGLELGQDERQLALSLALTGVLALTVIGVAFLLFVAFLSALALASRAAANAPELAVEAAEHAPEIGAYFGTAEWVAVWVTGAAFALFSIWFLTRLLLAFPETVRLGKVQAMAALGLSRGRMFAVTLSGAVFVLAASAIVWALRLIPHGEGLAGTLVLFGTSWAGLTVTGALVSAFLTALDDELQPGTGGAAGT